MPSDRTVHALIVDDDRTIQRLLADTLAQEGFQVTVERDGAWALKTFSQKRFDVVLLDLLLPELNGYQVAHELLATPRGRKVPIIMISGVYKSPLQQEEAVAKHGAFAFLEKPLKQAQLLQTLHAALGDRYPAPPHEAYANQAEVKTSQADPRALEERSEVERTSRTAVSGAGMRGQFDPTSFAEVLAQLSRDQASGGLLLRRDKVKKIVYLREGTPVSVKSNLLSECLGRVMVRERMISLKDCEESLRRMKSTRRQQGTVLIEMGCISPHNLGYALELQLRTKLLEVFGWRTGEYQLNPKLAVPQETVQLGMPTAAVLYEGIRRNYDGERLAALLDPLGARRVARSENPRFAFQDMGLGEEELAVLKAANGRRTLQQLRELGLMPPLEAARFIYALLCAQMIELQDPAADMGRDEAANLPWEPEIATQEPIPSPTVPPLPPRRTKSHPAPPAPAAAPEPFLPDVAYAPSALPEDEREQRERLLAKAAQLRKMDFFARLGLPTTAEAAEAKRAYLRLAQELRPEKFLSSASAETRELAREIDGLLTTAYETLAHDGRRAAYLRDLKAGKIQPAIGADLARLLAAEQHFTRGTQLLGSGHLGEAHAEFAEAVKLSDTEGEFYAYLGWTRYQMQPETEAGTQQALRELEHAVELNPTHDRAYLFSGYIYKALGRPDKAERLFEKAIECNPACDEALRELSVLSWAGSLNKKKAHR